MTTDTLTLTDFLLARIAEDEGAAMLRLAGGDPAAVDAVGGTTAAAFTRLAFTMKRVNIHLTAILNRYRAAEYADHPDYRDEWKL